MKQLLILTTVILLSSFQCLAQRHWNIDNNSFTESIEECNYDKSIEQVEDGYIVTYKFHSVNIIPSSEENDRELWEISGFSQISIAGYPIYPYRTDSFAISQYESAETQLLDQEWIEITSAPAYGKNPEFLDSEDISAHSDFVCSGWYPENVVEEKGTRKYKDNHIYSLGLSPVQFDVNSGNARLCKLIRYKVKISGSRNESRLAFQNENPESGTFDTYLARTVLNGNMLSGISTVNDEWSNDNSSEISDNSTLVNHPNYISRRNHFLIISHSLLKSAVDKFARWKRTLGFNVKTAYADSWTSESIKQCIKNYIDTESTIDYLLLIGSDSLVPTDNFNYGSTVKTTISDLGYALVNKGSILSDEDYLPDVKYGRIIANDNSEAAVILNKIENYERNPVDDSSFYNSQLFLSSFNPRTDNEKEDDSCCQTTFEISEYMKLLGKSSIIGFSAKTNVSPRYWSNNTIKWVNGKATVSTDRTLPGWLQRPAYPWNYKASDIVSAINSGVSQVFYYCHSAYDSWGYPYFPASDISSLTNGNKLPLVISMGCNTGNFSSPGCLAEKFMIHSNGGAIAMFAFSNASIGGFSDMIGTGLYNAMWPEPGIYPYLKFNGTELNYPENVTTQQSYELGEISLLARTIMYDMTNIEGNLKNNRLYINAITSLFGDPSMNLYLDAPKELVVDIDNNGRLLNVSAPSDAIVSIFDSSTSSIVNIRGGFSGYLLPLNYLNVTVTVSKPGYKPVVKKLMGFSPIQKRTATDSDGFIREDRVWHLRQVSNLILAAELFPDYSERERWYYCFFMDFAFSGTKEFHGKTYNVCYAWYTNEDIPYKEAAPIGFMREEGSKIYSYCPPGWEQYIYDNYHIDVMRCASHPGYWEDSYPEDCEVLVYDFSLENGDYLFYNEEVYSQFIDREDYHRVQGLAVDNVKDIEIDGKTYKSQDYSIYFRKKIKGDFFDNYTHFYTVLSSVGPLNGYPCYPSRLSYTLSKSNIELMNITDPEGNMIFDYSPWLPIPDAVDKPSAGNIVRTVYHDLFGRETENPAGGVYIRTRIYDSGRQVTDKVVFAD